MTSRFGRWIDRNFSFVLFKNLLRAVQRIETLVRTRARGRSHAIPDGGSLIVQYIQYVDQMTFGTSKWAKACII